MKSSIYILLSAVLFLASCHRLPLQTVESGYFLFDENDPQYKFSRNQESSVDIKEPQVLKQVLNDMAQRFMDRAYLRTEEDMKALMSLYKYKTSLYNYAPYDYLALSKEQEDKTQVIEEMSSLIENIARISALQQSQGSYNEAATIGRAGRISNGLSTELIYVDEKGRVLSDIFQYEAMSFIAIDQIFNIHLNKDIITDKALIEAHEANNFLANSNYTLLEHHWDLAYGYYKYFIRDLAKGNGLTELRGLLRELDLAFILGRIDINYHLYNQLPDYVETIRKNIVKLLSIRIREYLLGANTISNLQEDSAFAFPNLSRAYALIYALAFIPADHTSAPYLSLKECKALQAKMLISTAFWDKERLLANETTDTSLLSIYNTILEKLSNDNK